MEINDYYFVKDGEIYVHEAKKINWTGWRLHRFHNVNPDKFDFITVNVKPSNGKVPNWID